MGPAQQAKLQVVRQSGEPAEDKSNPADFPEPVTQRELVEILTLEEEVRLIRHEIMMKKLRIASKIQRGAVVESGLHEYNKDKLKIYPFRGAILRQWADVD